MAASWLHAVSCIIRFQSFFSIILVNYWWRHYKIIVKASCTDKELASHCPHPTSNIAAGNIALWLYPYFLNALRLIDLSVDTLFVAIILIGSIIQYKVCKYITDLDCHWISSCLKLNRKINKMFINLQQTKNESVEFHSVPEQYFWHPNLPLRPIGFPDT